MEILQIIGLSVASLVLLFIVTKLLGNKQVSQITMFDYITGITIGSIAAEMATKLERDFWHPLIAMAVYFLFGFGMSLFSMKSMFMRKFLIGRPLVLYEKGKLYEKNLLKARLDINEFQMMCRNGGFFDLESLETVVIESNGKLSFIPLAGKRPVTPEDLGLSPSQEDAPVNVVIDGKALTANLKLAGKNETWLRNELKKQKFADVSQVSLATCDKNGALCVYEKIDREMTKDVFT